MDQFSLFGSPSLSVSDITLYLRQLLESDEILRNLWVQGEVSNLSRPVSGHIYFTLKDSTASLRCVIWRSAASRLQFALQNGQAVEAHGAISVYDRDGAYQLYIDTLRPSGEGLLYQQFMRLKAQLEIEGLFNVARKRPIPERPGRIGLVTSPTGAALQDILNTLRRRCPLVDVFVYPAAVQGEEAPLEIVTALEKINLMAKPDVIILARGGGSLEDLRAFNDERVVRAIVASVAPVITGIGHETDFTLADFAADQRAPTPSGAAELAAPEKGVLLGEVGDLENSLAAALMAVVDSQRRRLDDLGLHLKQASPLWRIQSNRQRLDELTNGTLRIFKHALQLRSAHLNGETSRLAALNPQSIMGRGFAIVSRLDGSPIRSVAQVHPADVVRTHLVDGQFIARVENL
jgi:exodeoxyribonuclease VII large subunit